MNKIIVLNMLPTKLFVQPLLYIYQLVDLQEHFHSIKILQ